jgi:hypothetical protein
MDPQNNLGLIHRLNRPLGLENASQCNDIIVIIVSCETQWLLFVPIPWSSENLSMQKNYNKRQQTTHFVDNTLRLQRKLHNNTIVAIVKILVRPKLT